MEDRAPGEELAPTRNGAPGPAVDGPATGAPDPFPPPFRWGESDGGRDRPAEATQVVAPGGSPGRYPSVADPVVGSLVRGLDDLSEGPPSDRTQVVSDEPAPGPERTQVVGGTARPGRERPAIPRLLGRPAASPPGPRTSGRTSGGPGPLTPTPPPERTQVVPGPVQRLSDRRPVPAHTTTPPWVGSTPRSPAGSEGTPGADLFTRGHGPRASTVAGTAAVIVLVLVVLVLSFVLA